MRPRKLDAKERDFIGKRANEIGPLGTFRELVEAADEKMLAANSTGGVLKPMKEQNQLLIYTIMFKDGIDGNNNVPLAHAILTDHTVPGIGYFLGNVIHSVNQVTTKKKVRPPSFIVIDFSAALMNAALQQFNIETINKHLKRCWNVIRGKYSAEIIRSLSFIHLCCCHVMHAVARSLNAEKIEKKTREAVLYIFAYMLCSNDINQLYDTLELVIDIFGDPNEQNAKKKLDRICSLKLNVDEENCIFTFSESENTTTASSSSKSGSSSKTSSEKISINQQRHSNEILCSRSDCPQKERKCTSTELDIFSNDECIDKFEIETEGVCSTMVKRPEEMNEAEALQKKYRDGRVPLFNCETNTNEYERGWLCNARNIQTSPIFDYGHPPIIIVSIKPFSRRINEGYEPNEVRLRDLKDTIRISSIKRIILKQAPPPSSPPPSSPPPPSPPPPSPPLLMK
ncbi:unnamed protein product [Rotaria sordida]|uniref:Transposase n=1 Tax=Rotaria sordida TaxID=392033 RepID=A0A815PPI7_9BILA|nr:unnamed protein product [Rotaria sordida]CAF1639344.1 unnamed protein product [Rotaria sordida]